MNLNLPFIMFFDDYHEIDALLLTLNSIVGGKQIKSYEIPVANEECGDSDYRGLFYTGKRPKKSEYSKIRVIE